MLLSDRDIRAEVDSGKVRLDPYSPELIQPSSIDVRLDRYFRVFENHRYPHIDPAVEQPDLTRLVETEGKDPFVLHPGEFVLASTYEVVTLPDDVAGRLEGEGSWQAGVADPLDGGLDRPGLFWPRDPGTLERGHAPDQALARDEDRPAVLVPYELAGGAPVRIQRLRLALPGSARPHAVPLLPQLLPHRRLSR